MATDGATNFTSPADELARLREENDRLRRSLQQTQTQVKESSQTVELLRAERAVFLEQLHQKDHRIDSLQHQLQHMLRRLFGRSAEKIDSNQLLLFETVLNELAPQTFAPEESESPTAASSEAASSDSKPKGHGRRRLPTNLPRRKVIHDLPEHEKPCPCCGEARHVIGQEISEQLEFVPARLSVVEHVRLKYACRTCEANASEAGPQIATAPRPLSPIEKGLAAPGLLSYVIVSKYSDHLPLHRLEFYDARASDAAASAQALAYIRLLYDVEAEAKKQVAAMEKTFATAKAKACASRKNEGSIEVATQRDDVAQTVDDGATASETEDIASLRRRRAEMVHSLRKEQSAPRLEQFKAWLESQQASRGGPVLPKSSMGQAITYALNQWDALCVYTTNGDLAIDNNASENALRRVAVGRKNWLFCGSDHGGNTAAILFSLIATCQRHKVEPFNYLRDVLTRIAATPIHQLDEFLPDRWSPVN